MIGLIFYGAIGFWLLLAFVLGYKIPLWLKLQPIWAWLFIPLVFFAPVIDEVIAIPQAYALCKQAEEAFWYDPTIKGGVLKYHDDYFKEEKILGFNITADIRYATSVLKDSQRPAIKSMDVVNISSGFLNMPAGSSGSSMPLLLPVTCPSRLWVMNKYQDTRKLLNLTLEPRPSIN